MSVFRKDTKAEIEEELQFHLDRKTEELVAEGWTRDAARQEAERRFGDYQGILAECGALWRRYARRQHFVDFFDGWAKDVSYAMRQLVRHRGFAFVAILTLALGVGATTSIFSVVNGVLLRALPYDDAEELIRVWVSPERGSMSAPDFGDIENQLASVETLTGYSTSSVTVTGLGDPILVPGARTSNGLLGLFALSPHIGRDLRADEWGPDAAAVVVIGHGAWQRLFGGSPDVLGQTLQIGGVTREIVGVAPAGFDFPNGTELWYPRTIDPEGCGRGCHTWRTVGRLADGATLAAAQAELNGLATVLAQNYPESNTGKSFRVVGLQEDLVGDVSRGLWILLAAVAAVLLIACANVANLLLVRATHRSGEMAVRGALGASRTRLVRQTLVESALLATLGGALGLAIAQLSVTVLKRSAATTIPRIEQVTIDGPVLLFALSLICVVTLLFGSSPAFQGSRVSLVGALTHAGRGADTGASHRQRRALVMVEVGLSVVLLVAAGLLLRTFGQLHAVQLGYQTQDIVRFSLNLPNAEYESLEEVRTFYRTLEARLDGLPGVESVGSVFGAPLGGGSATGDVLIDGRPEPEPGTGTEAAIRAVSPEYLQTMRIPLLRGRTLEPSDDVDGLPVTVVNEVFVRENFGDTDPIGERVRITVDFGYGSPSWTIVGVVGDVRSRSVTEEPRSEVYVPHGQYGPNFLTTNLRMSAGATLPVATVRAEVARMDANLPVRGLETLEDAVAADIAPTRFYLMLVSIFAGVALVLAAVGLYGVLAYLVSTRRKEIGVRVALGAARSEIVKMVILEGLKPVAVGLVVGLVSAFLAGRLLDAVLYGVPPRDPLVFLVVPLVLAVVAVAAAWVPAARAARLDPSIALNSD